MPHRALITGVSGFVGGYLAEHLLACGDAVLGISPDGTWLDISPPAIRDRVSLLTWDLAEAGGPCEDVRQAIERFQPSAVYHLAAISIPSECGREKPTPLAERINVDGTRRVLRLAASLASSPRVLLVSSSHVYAPVTRQTARVDEGAPLGPRGGYGLTKLAAEAEIRQAVARGQIDALIARAFHHTGPGHSPRMMLPEWAMQFAQPGDEPVRVQTLDAWLDLADVRDVVRAYRLLIERGFRGEVYNVGSGIARRSGDILEVLRTLAGSSRPVVELCPGVKQEPIADIRRLVELTGWQARIPLERLVADTLAWWRRRTKTEG
jgi:GDP-4-dehydro-6-deoxy-D-mannose reductase